MNRHLTAACLAMFISMAAPLLAHHSFAAEYDADKPVTLNGVLTKVEWMNPHIYFYIDVKDAKGVVTKWSISGPSPTNIYDNGGRKATLSDRIGQTVKVQGYLAKNGTPLANMKTVWSVDGKVLLDRIGEKQ